MWAFNWAGGGIASCVGFGGWVSLALHNTRAFNRAGGGITGCAGLGGWVRLAFLGFLGFAVFLGFLELKTWPKIWPKNLAKTWPHLWPKILPKCFWDNYNNYSPRIIA